MKPKPLVTELGAEGSLWHLVFGMKLSQSFSLLAGQLCGAESKWYGAITALPPCLQEHIALGRRMSHRMLALPGAYEQGWVAMCNVTSQPEVTLSLRLFFLL